mmetsp:Transcript_106/g.221  ORF Transcript_106/g.221 Transcript_106/m.221 type:complete len:81 (+) Transcript_106:518-760(+)
MSELHLLKKLNTCCSSKAAEKKLSRYDCDLAFACYLAFVAQRVSMGSYVRTLKFVLLYRDHFLTKTRPKLSTKKSGESKF